jgi:hypothetical protein
VAESNSIENSCFSNLQIKRKLCSDTDYQEITTWFLFNWNFRFHKLRWVKEHVWSEIFLCEINNSHTPASSSDWVEDEFMSPGSLSMYVSLKHFLSAPQQMHW